MPLAYVIAASGRSGAALRVARSGHELLATGPAARIGSLLPDDTTITTLSASQRPLEVRLGFNLVLWLVMGCLIPHADVLVLRVYEHMVGASRLGAAIDKLVTAYIEKNGDDVTTPSVVRRYFLELDIHLRGESM